MTQTDAHGTLRRLARAHAPRDDAPSVERVLRLSFARAAEAALDLRLTVTAVAEETGELDTALAALPKNRMLIGLCGATGLVGLAAVDDEARAAAVEMQTLGYLREAPAEPRGITATDAALAVPLLDAFLADFAEAGQETRLAGWTAGCSASRGFEDTAAAALVLQEGRYRTLTVTADLGVAGRAAGLEILLPEDGPERFAAKRPAAETASPSLRAVVMEAPADLTAVLHRMRLPLERVEGFAIGDVLPLPGVTVASVRLEGPGRAVVARARLGQTAGLRAVRLEQPVAPELGEALPKGPARLEP